jgi:hypothetical protein
MLMKFIQTRWENKLTVIQHLDILKNHFITQADLNDLVLDLNQSKSQAEISASRLKGCNPFQQDITICYYHNCQDEMKHFFTKEKVV